MSALVLGLDIKLNDSERCNTSRITERPRELDSFHDIFIKKLRETLNTSPLIPIAHPSSKLPNLEKLYKASFTEGGNRVNCAFIGVNKAEHHLPGMVMVSFVLVEPTLKMTTAEALWAAAWRILSL